MLQLSIFLISTSILGVECLQSHLPFTTITTTTSILKSTHSSSLGAFHVRHNLAALSNTNKLTTKTTTRLHLSSQGGGSSNDAPSPRRKKRVRRKTDVEIGRDKSEPQQQEQEQPSKNYVEMEVRDIRDMVSGSTSTSSTTGTTMSSTSGENITNENKEENGLENLLADAKRMRGASSSEEKGDGIGDKIRDVIGTIVTIDFFVVCGFLLWFVAGIFCSTVLKDDTVQIAFNNNFERLVQPALGVLMIGAITGALGGKKEED